MSEPTLADAVIQVREILIGETKTFQYSYEYSKSENPSIASFLLYAPDHRLMGILDMTDENGGVNFEWRCLNKEFLYYLEQLVSKLSIWNIKHAVQIGTIKNTKQHRKSGRPHLPEDVWAWEQVNMHNRKKTEVYKEWLERDDVKVRGLQDPERQFDRITKPEWGNKSGQNI